MRSFSRFCGTTKGVSWRHASAVLYWASRRDLSMTTAQAEQIINAYYEGDPAGLKSDLKIYASQGLTTVEAIAEDLLDSDWDYKEEA